MTVYVDNTPTDFKTDYHPSHCERQCVRCKEWKNFVCLKRYYHANTGRYLIQYRCECLDAMKKYNDKRKTK